MPVRLGIDTGGTYTDAVLLDPGDRVIAKAKALTTKHALVEGVREAVTSVLAGRDPGMVGLVGLSTTLATNALVEGHGTPVGLILIGASDRTLERADLRRALGADPVRFVAGGHDALGAEQAPLDIEAAAAAVRELTPKVEAFAITGLFAVRNPAHERAVAEIARAAGRPSSCSHELSSKLDAPRRALTTLLNARLIGDIHRLIGDVRMLLAERGIEAPLMVVKGDGSLVGAETARSRPVETILSGPAASTIGAAFLSGSRDVVVADIGGTTTDVAFLRDGRPELDAQGARVGGWRTMVEALRVHTWGLGGDSEVRRDPARGLVLGPRRIVPISLLAARHPAVLATLAEQRDRPVWRASDGRFAVRLRSLADDGASLSRHQRELWGRLADGPLAVEEIVDRLHLELPLRRLVERGVVIEAGFTPSDAAHVLGLQSGWSREAATLAAELRARLDAVADDAGGSADPHRYAEAVLERARTRTAEVLLRSALAEEGLPADADASGLADALIARALTPPQTSLVITRLGLDRPVVAIGGPAALIYPDACRLLGTAAVIPEHAEVANAVGAVAGDVVQSAEVPVTAPAELRFRVHLASGPRDLGSLEDALALAEREAVGQAEERARQAGAVEIATHVARRVTVVDDIEGRSMFVEATVSARAVGRPALAG